MKAYFLCPNIDLFEGSGTLGVEAEKAFRAIAEIVADSLQQGDYKSHHAAIDRDLRRPARHQTSLRFRTDRASWLSP